MLLMSVVSPIRTRFAPSPTGELHLGGARTALFAYLFAKHAGGELLLRIEDTDQQRFVPGSTDRFMDDLAWLGITFDGEPLIQSTRVDRHREVAEQLVAAGAAYYEPSDPAADYGRKRDEAEYRAGRSVYRGTNRDRIDQPAGPSVIRLKVPTEGAITLNDAVRGTVVFDWSTVDDPVLIKSNGMSSYHLAAMVDDHDTGITHVLRTEEWLPSSPKHLYLYQAMGWKLPVIAHLPLVLAMDGKKLSKRIHGETVWVGTYRQRGYLAYALSNYLALLGWSPGDDREFMHRDELIATFSLDRVHKAGAKFDQAKLDAFQQHYVRALSDDALAAKLSDYLVERSLPKPADSQFGRLISILHDRLERFDEFPELINWVEKVADYPAERLIFRKSTAESTKTGLSKAIEALEVADATRWDSVDSLSGLLTTAVSSSGLTNGDVFWPVRMALTGLDRSPSPAQCLFVLGREEALRRLNIAHATLA